MSQVIQQTSRRWPDTLAVIVSYIVNPLCLPPLGAGLILGHFMVPRSEWWLLVSLSTFFYCVLPLVYVLWMVRKGQTESLEVRLREDRNGPLLFSFVISILGGVTMVVASTTNTQIVLVMVATQFIATAIVLTVTRFWKISLHLTGVSGFVGALVYVSGRYWIFPDNGLLQTNWTLLLIFLIPLLVWARIRTNAHDFSQTVAGVTTGIVSVIVGFHFGGILLGLFA